MEDSVFTQKWKRSSNVVTHQIAGETVLISLCPQLSEGEAVFILNELGNQIWQKLDGQQSTQTIVEQLETQYDVSNNILVADINEYLHNLRDKGLVETIEF